MIPGGSLHIQKRPCRHPEFGTAQKLHPAAPHTPAQVRAESCRDIPVLTVDRSGPASKNTGYAHARSVHNCMIKV